MSAPTQEEAPFPPTCQVGMTMSGTMSPSPLARMVIACLWMDNSWPTMKRSLSQIGMEMPMCTSDLLNCLTHMLKSMENWIVCVSATWRDTFQLLQLEITVLTNTPLAFGISKNLKDKRCLTPPRISMMAPLTKLRRVLPPRLRAVAMSASRSPV